MDLPVQLPPPPRLLLFVCFSLHPNCSSFFFFFRLQICKHQETGQYVCTVVAQPGTPVACRHPRVVGLLDIFELDSCTFATVLELCEGNDLDLHLQRHQVCFATPPLPLHAQAQHCQLVLHPLTHPSPFLRLSPLPTPSCCRLVFIFHLCHLLPKPCLCPPSIPFPLPSPSPAPSPSHPPSLPMSRVAPPPLHSSLTHCHLSMTVEAAVQWWLLQVLPEKEAKAIASQVFDGLAYLNGPSRRIIHYDLKPANILFNQLGQVKITVSPCLLHPCSHSFPSPPSHLPAPPHSLCSPQFRVCVGSGEKRVFGMFIDMLSPNLAGGGRYVAGSWL